MPGYQSLKMLKPSAISRLSTILVFGCCFIQASLYLYAQLPLGDPAQTFSPPKNKTDDHVIKKRVRYVLVPVIVKDKKNQHVSGLTKDDFSITENEKQQTIATVEEIKADSEAVD